MPDPLPRYARVNPSDPEAFAQCDRCGFWRNISDLVWQLAWAGQELYSQEIMVCRDRCYDTPNEQLRTIILPPDPPPTVNARVPNFAYEEQTPIIFQFAQGAAINSQYPSGLNGPAIIMCDQSGETAFTLQYLTSS